METAWIIDDITSASR